MKKLKGVKKMNKALRKVFSETTGIDLPMKLDSDFYYLPEKEKIKYSILISNRADRNFQAFLKNIFHLEIHSDIELFCVSVLHEFGHYETYDKVSEGDYLFSKDEQVRIEMDLKENPDDDKIYTSYFFLPLEIIATMWAVEFIEEDRERFNQLVFSVEKILHNFYAQNIAHSSK